LISIEVEEASTLDLFSMFCLKMQLGCCPYNGYYISSRAGLELIHLLQAYSFAIVNTERRIPRRAKACSIYVENRDLVGRRELYKSHGSGRLR
jgi:hypothetical protein